jgi:hypothetical protein
VRFRKRKQQRADPSARQIYYAVEPIVCYPIFIALSALIALLAVLGLVGRTVGIGAAAFGTFLVFFGLRASLRATVDPDGTLTFTSLTGSVTTNIASVTRIAIVTAGRTSAVAFDFDGRRVEFGNIGGRGLARYIIQRRPDIPHPARLNPKR